MERTGQVESQLALDGGGDGIPHVVPTGSRGDIDGNLYADDAGRLNMRSNLTVLAKRGVVGAGGEGPVGAVLDLGLEVDRIASSAKDLVGHGLRRVGMGQTVDVVYLDGKDFTVAGMGQKRAAIVAVAIVAVRLDTGLLVVGERDGAIIAQNGAGDVKLGKPKDDLAAFDEAVEAGPLLPGQSKSLPGLAGIVGVGALVLKVPAGDGLAWNFQGGDALDDAAVALSHWPALTLVLALSLKFAGCSSSRAKVGLLLHETKEM